MYLFFFLNLALKQNKKKNNLNYICIYCIYEFMI